MPCRAGPACDGAVVQAHRTALKLPFPLVDNPGVRTLAPWSGIPGPRPKCPRQTSGASAFMSPVAASVAAAPVVHLPLAIPEAPPVYRRPVGSPLVDVVVPIYNEEHVLASSIVQLRTYLDTSFPFLTVVTIVDNGSTDRSAQVAGRLVAELEGVRFLSTELKGRGRALRTAWRASEAEILAYMDVDLSTSLDALLPLVAPLVSRHSAVSVGSRLAPGSRVVRCAKREVISRAYNRLLKAVLRSSFSDAQCGFKALRADVAPALLADVRDDEWFFDTELLICAQRRGLRVHEVPVDWIEDPDSRVAILRTAGRDLAGIVRLLRRGSWLDTGRGDGEDRA